MIPADVVLVACSTKSSFLQQNHRISSGIVLRDKGRTIRKTYGGGAGGEVQKKCSRKGKLNEKKIHARQLILKNIHAMA